MLHTAFALDVPFLSQRDPLWGSNQLGTCAVDTIYSSGCATTSKAMIFNYYQPNYTNPAQLNDCLTDNGGYADGCLAPHDETNNICAPSGLTFAGHITSDFNTTIDLELSNGYPVMAKVQSASVDMHFIIITGKSGDTYSINDPWDLQFIDRTLETGCFGSYVIDALWLYDGVLCPTVPQNLSLARIQGQDAIYWLQHEKAYHVLSMEIINDMSSLPGWDHICDYPEDVLEIIPPGHLQPEGTFLQGPDFISTGPESNGLLIKLPDDPKVYIIENGERRWITTEDVFNDLGYDLDDIIIVSNTLFADFDDPQSPIFIPEGDPIYSAPTTDLTIYDFWRRADPIYADPLSSIWNPNFDAQYKIRNDGTQAVNIERLALTIHDSNNNHLWDMAAPNTGDPRYYDNIRLNPGDTHHFEFSVSYFTQAGNFKVVAKAKIGGQWYELASMDFVVLPVSPAQEFTLTVNSGAGGSVSGDGISCPADCSEIYTEGTEVTLTATAYPNYELDSWTGCDTTNVNQCTVTMDSDRHVEAYFIPLALGIYSHRKFRTRRVGVWRRDLLPS